MFHANDTLFHQNLYIVSLNNYCMAKLLFAGIIVLVLVAFFGLVATFGAMKGQASLPSGNAVLSGNALGDVQEVFVKATSAGIYDKDYVQVKKGVPVNFNFSAEPNAGCGKVLLIPQWKVYLLSANGETKTATFLPEKEGKYDFHCSMKMFRGTIEVVP